MRIGLTGGIGSGKSSVARLLAHLGASVIDADDVAKSLTGADGPAIELIRGIFGHEFVTSERALDRVRMREEVFRSQIAKSKLESILHPLIQAEILRQVKRLDIAGVTCMVLEIPLLMETTHWRKILDAVCVVDCCESTQIERVVKRNGLTKEMVQKVMDSQSSRQNRLRGADIVLFNDDIALPQLACEVKAIAPSIGL